MVSISDMPNVRYWQDLERIILLAKYKIQKEDRIVDTCFKSLATVEGNLFTRHPKILIMYTKIARVFCK